MGSRAVTNFFCAIAFGIIVLVPAAANAAMWEFSGGLNIEQSIASDDANPPVGPYFGGGFVNASLDDVSGLFTWEYFFGGLSGPAANAHFHEGPVGVPGGVALGVDFGGTSGSFSGSATLAGSDIDALTKDENVALGVGDPTLWYLNIHTDLNGDGELRGQLFVDSVVPVPAAVWMMMSALGTLIGLRRLG